MSVFEIHLIEKVAVHESGSWINDGISNVMAHKLYSILILLCVNYISTNGNGIDKTEVTESGQLVFAHVVSLIENYNINIDDHMSSLD